MYGTSIGIWWKERCQHRYHGKRWKAKKKAMEELGIENGVLLMDKIRNKMKNV